MPRSTRRPSRAPSPDLGNFTDAFTRLRADYNASKNDRFRRRRAGVGAVGRPADYHYASEGDYLRMMELSRDVDRNDRVVGQGINRLVDNVIQSGIKLDPQTGDDDLNAELKGRWDEWAGDPDQCDIAGESSFHDIEKLALRQTIVDGDMVAVPLNTGELQCIEAHRIRTPRSTTRNVVHGVLLDKLRRRMEYWVTKEEINPLRQVDRVSEIDRLPVRNENGHRILFHIYKPKRLSQTRGITCLAPVADTIEMHDDIQFAKLVQQQIVSCFAILHAQDATGIGGGDVTDPQAGAQTTESLADGTTRTVEDIAPGMHYFAGPGETLTGFSPNVPNPEFFKHAMMALSFVAINLGLPVAVLLLDPSNTNFSGWRGAIDQARIGFREIQQWLVRRLHRPTYAWKVREWMAKDAAIRKAAARLEAQNIDVAKHVWKPPRWAYIEPLKDANADVLRWRSGLTSPRRLHGDLGNDWDEIYTESISDHGAAIRAAKLAAMDINQDAALQDGQPVHWRELLSMPLPPGLVINSDTTPDRSPRPAEADDE